MRKAISLFLFSLVLFLSLSSCSDGRVKIEDYEWKMRCVMHQEDNRIVYDAAEEMSSVYPGAKAVELTLVASNGKITVTDKTNDKLGDLILYRNPGEIEFMVTFGLSDELLCLLKDGLLQVSAVPYIKFKSHEGIADVNRSNYFNAKPSVQISLDYYNTNI